MNARELRHRFLEFFKSKDHRVHPSAPLIPIDVTGKMDETLLFTGAGMVQFKPYFRGLATPPHTRLVDSQKCVRAVDIEEVGNPSHLTFFEMLGNFSFGDYFKREAIEWAWEFLTSSEWLGIDPKKLCVTVFEADDEAFDLWAEIWRAGGYEPSEKIHRLGEDKNYWPASAFSHGPPGPCGPCSEIFFQVAPDSEMANDYVVDEAAGRWLEIWNLVFMQYEWKGHLKDADKPHLGYVKEGLDPLPAPCIDTGSGLERTSAVLAGFGDVYLTDVFSPIVRLLETFTRERNSNAASYRYGSNEALDRPIRVIADHIRTASFCIADGVLPSNQGRGYVLRRLIRRAILKGHRDLGFAEPFLADVFPSVIEALGDPYVELSERRELITRTLEGEESLFRATLSEGMRRFATLASECRDVFPGESAFFLYDTLGFPIEVTQELAAERGLAVDFDGYHKCMREAQERSRAAQGPADVFGGSEPLMLTVADGSSADQDFVGYELLETETRIAQISPRFGPDQKTTGDFQVFLNRTPFYAESGGQVGDTGWIEADQFSFRVTNTWKEAGMSWCDAKLVRFEGSGATSAHANLVGLDRDQIASVLKGGVFFRPVRAKVDAERRRDIVRNHTATHLLHAVLRQTLGTHVTQAGSLVAPDRLRFDFTHPAALSQEQLDEIERKVNESISAGTNVEIRTNVPISVAREQGAMMLFGEKYGDLVRTVRVGDISLELCGGCHVSNTAEIGLFKITAEGSSASGVRRIDAVTGLGAYEWVQHREVMLRTLSTKLKVPPAELPRAVERLQEALRDLKREKEQLLAASDTAADYSEVHVGPLLLRSRIVRVGGIEAAKLAVDKLVENLPNSVGLVAYQEGDKVIFFAKVSKIALAEGAHAGNFVREVAAITGGGGGGSPAFAQAGGKDAGKVEEAFRAAPELLKKQLGA
ncbi:MAG: Alanine--tRNA ligase [Fimbriimonadales bacterium]|nr:Alanine--tRNA ligase [Fimbriimonadales bacterium]